MKLWIARNIDGRLTLHYEQPIYTVGKGWDKIWAIPDSSLFPEVTFENSPKQVELNVINDNIDSDFDDEERNFQKIDIYHLRIGDYILVECEGSFGGSSYLKIVDIQQRFDAITGEPIIIVTDEEDEIWSTKTGRCLSNPKSFYELIGYYRKI